MMVQATNHVDLDRFPKLLKRTDEQGVRWAYLQFDGMNSFVMSSSDDDFDLICALAMDAVAHLRRLPCNDCGEMSYDTGHRCGEEAQRHLEDSEVA